jgi:hypothetical protein
MYQLYLAILAASALLFNSCASQTDTNGTNAAGGARQQAVGSAVGALLEEESRTTEVTDALKERFSWTGTLLQQYIKSSNNDLIQAANKQQLNEIALWDRMETKERKTCIVFHIGHDVTDKDGSRFATDGWVYVDTLTKQLYEYNAASDELVLFKGR